MFHDRTVFFAISSHKYNLKFFIFYLSDINFVDDNELIQLLLTAQKSILRSTA